MFHRKSTLFFVSIVLITMLACNAPVALVTPTASSELTPISTGTQPATPTIVLSPTQQATLTLAPTSTPTILDCSEAAMQAAIDHAVQTASGYEWETPTVRLAIDIEVIYAKYAQVGGKKVCQVIGVPSEFPNDLKWYEGALPEISKVFSLLGQETPVRVWYAVKRDCQSGGSTCRYWREEWKKKESLAFIAFNIQTAAQAEKFLEESMPATAEPTLPATPTMTVTASPIADLSLNCHENVLNALVEETVQDVFTVTFAQASDGVCKVVMVAKGELFKTNWEDEKYEIFFKNIIPGGVKSRLFVLGSPLKWHFGSEWKPSTDKLLGIVFNVKSPDVASLFYEYMVTPIPTLPVATTPTP